MLRTDLPEIITETLPGPKAAEVIKRREKAVPSAIRCAYPVVIDKGEGAMIQDVDGNKEFNADVDTLVGEMVEYEPGLYELENLRYGGYFLYEKQAPANYVKDDAYPVSYTHLKLPKILLV